MKLDSSRASLVAGFSLLLIANAALLAVAGWNRWGGPRARIVLTERELSLPEYREEGNTGLSLSLELGDEPPPAVVRVAWRKRYRLPRADHPWIDRGKLRELGFRADLDFSDPAAPEAYAQQVDRRVFLVLEHEGEAWRRWLAAAEDHLSEVRRKLEIGAADRKEVENAEELLALDRLMRSRLLPVDAGIDLESLRRRYPKERRYLIVRGIISLAVPPQEGGPKTGSRLQVLPDRVHVPVRVRPQLTPFLPGETWRQAQERERKETEAAWPSPTPPRYRAELAFGQRLEPWIVSVHPGGGQSAASRLPPDPRPFPTDSAWPPHDLLERGPS